MNVELCFSDSRGHSHRKLPRQLRVCLAWVAISALLFLLPARSVRAITFGELDLGQHPAAGAFVQIAHLPGTDPNRPIPRVRGSGCLIHPRVFLTAGHVTNVLDGLIKLNGKEEALASFAISFGDDALDSTTWYQIAEVFTHPGFRSPPDSAGGGPMTDVGVFILRNPVRDVVPIALAPAGFLNSLKREGLLREQQLRAVADVRKGTSLIFVSQ